MDEVGTFCDNLQFVNIKHWSDCVYIGGYDVPEEPQQEEDTTNTKDNEEEEEDEK